MAKLRLARYTQQLMDEIAIRKDLQYWQTRSGAIYLFRGKAGLQVAERNSRLLRDHGRHRGVLDFHQTIALEPALRHIARALPARSMIRPTAPAVHNGSPSA